MSNEIFLKQINIPSFRNYISDFKLDIPDEPGLTVLVGANGLGKSSILHAIEWGLTGKVERIEKADASAKAKLSAVGDRASVKLVFSDEFTIDRMFNSTDNHLNTLEEAIRKRFVHESWSNLSDLAASLQFTHFRGQCALQHFSNQEGKERYRRLEGVSRIGQLVDIQQKLERRKTSDAFKNIKVSIDEKKNRLNETRKNLKELLAHKQTLISLARAEMAKSPNEVHDELSKLRKQLREMALSISMHLQDHSEISSIPLFLEKIQVDLQKIESELSTRTENILKWQNNSEEYMCLLRLLIKLAEDQHAMMEKQSLINKDIEEATGVLRAAELQTGLAHGNLNSVTLRLTRLQQLQRDLSELANNYQRLAEAESKYIDEQTIYQAHESAYQEAENAINNARKLIDENHKLLAELNLWRQTKGMQEKATEQMRQLQQIKVLNEKAKKEEAQITTDEESNKLLIQKWIDARIDLESQLHAAQRNTKVILGAVASIASALKESDLDCPVCSTPHAPGKLKELALSAAATSDSLIGVIEKQLKDLDNQSVEANRQLAICKSRREANERSYEQEKELQKKVDDLTEELRKNDFLKSFEVENFEAVLLKGIAELCSRVEISEKKMSSTDELLQLQKVFDAAKYNLTNEADKIRQLTDKVSELRNTMEVQKGRIDTATDDLDLRTDDLSQLGPLIDKQAKCQAHEEQVLMEQKRKEAELQEIVKDKMDALALQSSELKELMRTITEKNEAKDCFKTRWVDSGFFGEPTTENVKSQIQELDGKAGFTGTLRKNHDALMNAFKVWNQQVELQEADKKLKTLFLIYNADTEGAFIKSLEMEERDNEIQYANYIKADSIRNKLTTDIKIRLGKVKTDTFLPLNNILDKFCAAMLTGWEHQIIADAVINKSSAVADLIIQSQSGKDLLPQLTLSEGQMAAVELSLMFSASETYPWSPWKALFLDDPLQHNDTIHAASFTDVLRNMIKEKGYQVVITTHDVDEAGYFLRKCRNVGIPTQYCHLLSRIEGKMMFTTNI